MARKIWMTGQSVEIRLVVSMALFFSVAADSAHATTFHTCMPRKTMVSTHPTGSYVPYYYELHRCSGGTQNPGTHRCWPVDEDEVKVHLHNVDQEKEWVTLQNHTQCREVCICGPCRDHNAISVNQLCKPTERWNSDSCRCVANCQGATNPRSGPGNEGFITLRIFIVAMTVELVALVVVVLVFRRWLFYRREKEPKPDGNLNLENREKSPLTKETSDTANGRWSHGDPEICNHEAV